MLKNDKPLNDKLDEYDNIVDHLFAPFSIFRQSFFSGQNEESFSSLTKGELKEFFSELLSPDRYEKVLRPANKERVQVIEKDIAGERGRTEEIEKIIETEPEFRQGMEASERELERIQTTIKNLVTDVDTEKQELDKLQDQYQKSEQAKRELERIRTDAEKKRKEVVQHDESVERKENRIKELQDKITYAQGELANAKKMVADRDRITNAYNRMQKLNKEIEQAIETNQIRQNIENEIALFEQNKANRINQIKEKLSRFQDKAESAKGVPCNVTLYKKCPLFAEKIDIEAQARLSEELAAVERSQPIELGEKLSKDGKIDVGKLKEENLYPFLGMRAKKGNAKSGIVEDRFDPNQIKATSKGV